MGGGEVAAARFAARGPTEERLDPFDPARNGAATGPSAESQTDIDILDGTR